jgi:hypothetical protein
MWEQTMHDVPMPCHLTVNYSDPDWESKLDRAKYCAGALVFFRNISKLSRDPDRPRMEADKETVFASPDEFVLHHMKGKKP